MVFPREMICLRNICVDTLHKGDTDDDDDDDDSNNNNNNNLESANVKRYNGVNTETSDMSTMNSNTSIAATRCSLGTWFVSGI
jgi:glycerol-3-phosphate cytidylyltransferase-like family protein